MISSIITGREGVYQFGDVTFDFNARTHLMGILNVTPDSFSDGGRFFDPEKALQKAVEMVEEGADILDIGGESSRPGSEEVSEEEEIRRILPVMNLVKQRLRVVVSVDTRKARVAERALKAGATIVNDITGLTYDPAMKDVIAGHKASVVVMHMKGTPATMQKNPGYSDVVAEVIEFLKRQTDRAEEAGINQVIVDPGIGFGKTLQHNLTLIKHLESIKVLGYPILVGPSRKSFLGTILDLPPDERMEGTSAAVTASILHGASLVRVHDVKEMKRVAMVADRIRFSP